MQDQNHNAANAISIQKDYAAVRKRGCGHVTKTVAVSCTDILEQKMGKDQKMYFLPKEKIESITGPELPVVLPANSCGPVPSPLSLQHCIAARHSQSDV